MTSPEFQPGDVIDLPDVTYAALLPDGNLEYRDAPGRAVMTKWGLAMQQELEEYLDREIGRGKGIDSIRLRDNLYAYIGDVSIAMPEEFAPNPVARRVLTALGGHDLEYAGIVAIINYPDPDTDSIRDPLSDAQRQLIDGVYAEAAR